jgi:hypothetical protein
MPEPGSNSSSSGTKVIANGEAIDVISCNEVDSRFKEIKVGFAIFP